MTTIAWDGKSLATDSQITKDRKRALTTAVKIDHVTRGAFEYWIASGGSVSDAILFVKWFAAAMPNDERPTLGEGFEAIVINQDGIAETYESDLVGLPQDAPYTIGTGDELALGAMLAGANAHRAVEIAMSRDIYSGGAVQVVDILK